MEVCIKVNSQKNGKKRKKELKYERQAWYNEVQTLLKEELSREMFFKKLYRFASGGNAAVRHLRTRLSHTSGI